MKKLTKKQKEDRAVEALIGLTLRQFCLTDAEFKKEVKRLLDNPVKLSKADEAALKRAHPEFLKALRAEFRSNPIKLPTK